MLEILEESCDDGPCPTLHHDDLTGDVSSRILGRSPMAAPAVAGR